MLQGSRLNTNVMSANWEERIPHKLTEEKKNEMADASILSTVLACSKVSYFWMWKLRTNPRLPVPFP